MKDQPVLSCSVLPGCPVTQALLMLRKIERERAGLSAALLGMGTTAHQALVDTPAKHGSQPQVSVHTNKKGLTGGYCA